MFWGLYVFVNGLYSVSDSAAYSGASAVMGTNYLASSYNYFTTTSPIMYS